ncbi:stem-loop binding protein [Seminavis robusta]|uniref:Stem-loop binding protein n=1 Tax=Seminavis robusta TaxID=568900 RepID=A0A9N8HFP9_9STRA|nr:stem-loop binding protein [Seminavis robusta]|eukprot:Sro359_g126040.1 stem-loop binding protein (244) ;mRNA; f:15147-16022
MSNMNTSTETNRVADKRIIRKISPPSVRGKKRQVRGGNQYRSFNSRNHDNNNAGLKRQKTHHEPMELDPIFPKLDQWDPVHGRRIQQRRKAVTIGKNTPGYIAYCKQVPKEQRKPRSMETPPTPDHTLDIPTKRWQGMVKAWRRALHNYDPKDLFSLHNSSNDDTPTAEPSKNEQENSNAQTQQIEDAIAKGLLLDVTTPRKSYSDVVLESPVSVLSEGSPRRLDDSIMEDMAGEESDDDELL